MNRILRVGIILAAIATCAVAQRLDGCGAAPSADGWVHPPPAETLDRNLEGAGYTFTKESLLSGLHDPRPDVRSLAAWKLGRNGETGSATAIAQALSTEKDACAQGTMEGALGMLGGMLIGSSKQHPGGQLRPTPFQACTPSEPPVLALVIEQVPRPAYVAAGPVVRVTARNVSGRLIPFFWTASPADLFSVTVLEPGGGKARTPKEQDYLYHPTAELGTVEVRGTNGMVLPVFVGSSGPAGFALEPNAEAHAWEWRIGGDFDMSAPGVYRVSLGGPLEYLHTTVCSNTIDVTVDR